VLDGGLASSANWDGAEQSGRAVLDGGLASSVNQDGAEFEPH
jgi:hypothetical protein